MSILVEIYREMYLDKMSDTEEYREVRECIFQVWEKVEGQLGPALSGEAWDAMVALQLEESNHDFKEGFRLGVQLVLEGLSLPGGPKANR